MLPAALLLYRIDGDRLVPVLLGDADQPWLRALIDERARFVGRRRRELTAWLAEPGPSFVPLRAGRVAAHVLDRLAGKARPTDGHRPVELRAAVFGAAAAGTQPRERIIEEVAGALGLTPAVLELSLFADLPGEQRVGGLDREVSPRELAIRTNLALVRGLLARTNQLVLEVDGSAAVMARRAKQRGLLVNGLRRGGHTVLAISGPLALFHHTLLYGRALGDLVPLLATCGRWRLTAACVIGDATYRLRLESGQPLLLGDEPVRLDGLLAIELARRLRRAAPTWVIERDPAPLTARDALVFPDLAVVRGGRRWLLEIVGFWTPEHLARTLALYRAAGVDDLVLCIDQRRRCAAGDLPPGARIVWFKARIDPRAVIAAIDQAPP